MIEVEGLTHRYGPLTAVRDLSFRVERGEVLGLLGPNGAGKSTTLKAVVGLLRPWRGRITVQGHPLEGAAIEARRNLGYLPEAVSLYRELTVRDFLEGVARIKDVPAARRRAEIDRVVEACGLESVRKRVIGWCSRGYRQRIGLAQALVGDPPVLVLDEPTVGLDPAQIVEIRERVARLARDRAVILSTHILSEAQNLCTRVLILNNGRCLAEDTPANLEASRRGGTRLRLVAVAPATAVGGLLAGHGAVLSHTALPAGEGRASWSIELSEAEAASDLLVDLVAAGVRVLELSPERLGLEEVFLRLVQEAGAEEVAR
jgi:ABC-2 type transport system ATP-binding protein